MTTSSSVQRVALITGGAGAIGYATAQKFAANGIRVVLADLNSPKCDELALTLSHNAFGVLMDVTSTESVNAAVTQTVEKTGRIDILVNSAGIGMRGDNSTMSDEAYGKIIDINLKGPFRVSRAVIPHMKNQKYGRIVSLASRNSLSGGTAAYGSSKAGLEALSIGWARELGPWNITANCVAPGPVEITNGNSMLNQTPEEQKEFWREYIERTPVQRLAYCSDVAAGIVYLASEDAGFVTGDTISIAGGAQLAPMRVYATATA